MSDTGAGMNRSSSNSSSSSRRSLRNSFLKATRTQASPEKSVSALTKQLRQLQADAYANRQPRIQAVLGEMQPVIESLSLEFVERFKAQMIRSAQQGKDRTVMVFPPSAPDEEIGSNFYNIDQVASKHGITIYNEDKARLNERMVECVKNRIKVDEDFKGLVVSVIGKEIRRYMAPGIDSIAHVVEIKAKW
jgi:hypothetical protein